MTVNFGLTYLLNSFRNPSLNDTMNRFRSTAPKTSFLFAFIFLIVLSCKEKQKKQNPSEDQSSTMTEKKMAPSETQLGGLALYTVRDAMEADAKATLKTVAETGYANIEAAGYKDGMYYNMTPADFKAYLTELGLFNYDNATNTMSMTGGAENLAKILDELGAKAKAAELQLLYHNHDFEFMEDEDGIVPIDYLLENCDPELVNFQMDLFWVTKAGADPTAYFEKYPGRFKMWHVKDMDTEGKFAPVGNGTIDFGRILAKKDQSGMEYYMVEQDRTFTMTPLEAIKVSHTAIQKIGFK